MRPTSPRPLFGGLLVATALAVAGIPAPALAQDPAPATETAPPDDVAEAQRLYKLGEARYELFDFAAAIQYWTEAYALVPEGNADTHRVRTVLVRNLSVAHLKAYEVDEDAVHLRTGKMLLERYIKELQTYYPDEADSNKELTEAQETLAEIETKLAALEEAESNSGSESGSESGSGSETGTDSGAGTDTGAGTGPVDPGPTVDEEGLRKGKTLMVTGGIVLGVVGVGGIGMAGGGAAMGANAESKIPDVEVGDRPNQLDRGRLGNTLAYAGIAVGAVGVVTGAVLLAIGAKKKKAAMNGRVSVTPSLSPRNAGASISLEF